MYFTDQGHYLFKCKKDGGQVISKTLREPEVSAAFTLRGFDSGWLQDGIVRMGTSAKGNWFVFVVEPTKVTIELYAGELVTIPIPLTVLAGVGKTLHLFAMKTAVFIPGDEAFAAPFPNVYPDGKICWGQNAAPKVKVEDARAAWELFFKAPFNGDLAADKSSKFRHDVRKQLALLNGKRNYPVNTLVSMRRPIGQIIDGLIRGDR